jgi:acyl dehydratase
MTETKDARLLQARAEYWAKGRAFEDFHVEQRFEHRWSRTLTQADTILFSTQTLYFHAPCFSLSAAARAGYRDLLVNPYLVLNVVIGLSVEDLSEAGGPFVGLQDVRFGKAVLAGETLTARSVTSAVRPSRSLPDFGLVTWRTDGCNESGELVVSLVRSNLVMKESALRERIERMAGHDRIRRPNA